MSIIQAFTSQDISKSLKINGIQEKVIPCSHKQDFAKFWSSSTWTVHAKTLCSVEYYAKDNITYRSNINLNLCKHLCAYRKECVGYVFGNAEERCYLRNGMNVPNCQTNGPQAGFTSFQKDANFDESLYSPSNYGKYSYMLTCQQDCFGLKF